MKRRPSRAGTGSWLAASGLLSLLVLAPLAALVFAAFRGSGDLWQHLIAFVLPVAIRDTLVLLAGVGLLAVTIGTCTAWLVTAYDFAGPISTSCIRWVRSRRLSARCSESTVHAI